jgi:prepilin-type N-terminal cleavage/methylation domain-containing protein
MNIMISKKRAGFSLLEVLIAVVVLSIGLLALATLQANLARGTADARARTAAVSLVEERIETLRSFRSALEFPDVTSCGTQTISQGPDGEYLGGEFSMVTRITPLWLQGDGTIISGTDCSAAAPPAQGGVPPKFVSQRIEMRVTWQGGDGVPQTVSLTDVVTASGPGDSVRVVQNPDLRKRSPLVRVPASSLSEEGVIPIATGSDTGAAASNPEPDLSDTTTRFEVVNFVDNDVDPELIKRLEFTFATCNCNLNSGSGFFEGPFGPAYWDGERYTVPKAIPGKTAGAFVGNTQVGRTQSKRLCDACCRDHHDNAETKPKFDPFRPSQGANNDYVSGNSSANHNHYLATAAGLGSAVTAAGAEYQETCRFVRVNGVNRVATDTSLEHYMILRSLEQQDRYAKAVREYVGGAVVDAVTPMPGGSYLPLPVADNVLAGEFADILDPLEQQLAKPGTAFQPEKVTVFARGLLVDYMSEESLELINKVQSCQTSSEPECAYYRTRSVLEFVPFVAVNMTKLSNWGTATTEGVRPLIAGTQVEPDRGGGPNRVDRFRGEIYAANTGKDDVLASNWRSNSGLIVDSRPMDRAEAASRYQDSNPYDVVSGSTRFFLVEMVDRSGDAGTDLRRAQVFYQDVSCPQSIPNQTVFICELPDPAGTLGTLSVSRYNYTPQDEEVPCPNLSVGAATAPAGVTATIGSSLNDGTCGRFDLNTGQTPDESTPITLGGTLTNLTNQKVVVEIHP